MNGDEGRKEIKKKPKPTQENKTTIKPQYKKTNKTTTPDGVGEKKNGEEPENKKRRMARRAREEIKRERMGKTL